jgi:hypothetical protein
MKARMIVMGSQMRYYPEPPPAPLVLMEEDGIICASSAEYGVRVDAASIEQVTPESLKQAWNLPPDEEVYLSDVREAPEWEWLSPEMFLWQQQWWKEVAERIPRPLLAAV